MPLSKQAKEGIRRKFLKWYIRRKGLGGTTTSEIVDWWLSRFEEEGEEKIKRIINDLESNPNEDGSESPNIMHWIEQKQAQLKRKYLSKF